MHTLAVLSDGSLRGWGRIAEGEVGDGTTTVRATPVVVSVVSGVKPVPAVDATYTYDGDGLRASRTSSGSTQHFGWQLGGAVPLLLTDGSTSYLYDDAGLPVEQVDASGTALYFGHDQYGSTRLLTDQAGAVAATFTFDPYGTLTGRTGTADTPLRWNGQYQDPDTALYYLRARYYDPTTAQFLTRDPLTALTQAAYAFGGGDPLTMVDPSGLCWPSWACGVENSVAGAADHVGDFVEEHPWETVGIVLGIAAAATGVGALLEIGAGTAIGVGGLTITGSQLLLGTSAAAGMAAGALDGPGCLHGEAAACVGAGMGVIGGAAALPELLFLNGLEETSLGYASIKAVSAFGFQLGLGGTSIDLGVYLSRLLDEGWAGRECAY